MEENAKTVACIEKVKVNVMDLDMKSSCAKTMNGNSTMLVSKLKQIKMQQLQQEQQHF